MAKRSAPPALSIEERASVFKALGDPTRVRIVEFLRARDYEATGTEVAEHADISLALLCHHARVLVDAGLVTKRKEGQTSYWTLNRQALGAAIGEIME